MPPRRRPQSLLCASPFVLNATLPPLAEAVVRALARDVSAAWRRCQSAVVEAGATVATATTAPRGLRACRQHDDLGPDLRALVEVNDVLVDHADAAGRNALPDGPGLDRAVDAVE